ncbi:MAG: hypothetical protein G01um101438_1001 [Parcubacteria group bacterium Gr01-1014_38]|nr:MAG: hypothetical protein G01um101438_1001 [Parcubacteria group bacterium Gr01-1014_38]
MAKSIPSLDDVLGAWSYDGKYRNGWRGVQRQIFEFGAQHRWNFTTEAPTGSGKTRAMWTILKAFENIGVEGELLWVVPNKAILAQHLAECPPSSVKAVYGQSEHDCPWHASHFTKDPGRLVTADQLPAIRERIALKRVDEIPHYMHGPCPHFVDQRTGRTVQPGALGCQYYLDRYQARQGGIVLCTWAFFLFTHLFIKKDQYQPPAALVIDEVHTIGDLTRSCLSFDITDSHLERCIALLKRIEASEWKKLREFRTVMREIVKRKPLGEETLLKDAEVWRLFDILRAIDSDAIDRDLQAAKSDGRIDPEAELDTEAAIARLTRDLPRYVGSFERSLEGWDPQRHREEKGKKPLQYTCAFYVSEVAENAQVECKLVVRSWYVASSIRKMLSPHTMSFSATIGKDPDNLKFDTGIDAPILRLGSDFPVKNTRIYMPDDTPDLAYRAQKRYGTGKALKRMARAAKRCADQGLRSLVIVVSDKERRMFLEHAKTAQLNVMSYGENGRTVKEAALAFRDEGKGDCLVGTEAMYATGIDLPYHPQDMEKSVPLIFILRPGLPNPRSAEAQFASKRFGRRYWALQQWKAMLKALQGRGRNVRSVRDLGCTIFVSQQFRSIVFPSLPVWLEKAYRRVKTLDLAVREVQGFVLTR